MNDTDAFRNDLDPIMISISFFPIYRSGIRKNPKILDFSLSVTASYWRHLEFEDHGNDERKYKNR